MLDGRRSSQSGNPAMVKSGAAAGKNKNLCGGYRLTIKRRDARRRSVSTNPVGAMGKVGVLLNLSQIF